jgi:hypothetical protein
MPRATRPPSLPPDLLDGLVNALERVAAVADLLGSLGTGRDPALLRDRTVAGAARVIAEEADRMLALIRVHDAFDRPNDPNDP